MELIRDILNIDICKIFKDRKSIYLLEARHHTMYSYKIYIIFWKFGLHCSNVSKFDSLLAS